MPLPSRRHGEWRSQKGLLQVSIHSCSRSPRPGSEHGLPEHALGPVSAGRPHTARSPCTEVLSVVLAAVSAAQQWGLDNAVHMDREQVHMDREQVHGVPQPRPVSQRQTRPAPQRSYSHASSKGLKRQHLLQEASSRHRAPLQASHTPGGFEVSCVCTGPPTLTEGRGRLLSTPVCPGCGTQGTPRNFRHKRKEDTHTTLAQFSATLSSASPTFTPVHLSHPPVHPCRVFKLVVRIILFCSSPYLFFSTFPLKKKLQLTSFIALKL